MAGSTDGSDSDDSSHFESGVEHIYEAFICPLTKKVMRDPVALENGCTFEREAIENWLKECRERGQPPSCPITSQRLSTTDLNPSIALRSTIEEWRARNEAAKLEIICQSLNLKNEETNILQALKHVRHIYRNFRLSRHGLHNPQLTRMIIDTLRSSSDKVRYKALQTLQVVVEEDEESKGIVAEGDTVRTLVKFLSHESSNGRKAAISLIYELSKSEVLCEKIGSTHGAIILLVGMSSSKSENITAVDKADRALINLAKTEANVREMAINGRLQPLLGKLLEGSPETKRSMASLLGELALNNEVKVLVAQTVGSSLINLMRSRDMEQREAALQALNKVSSFEGSAKVLIEAGILPPLINDLFYLGPKKLTIQLKEVSATILANIVNAGYDFDTVLVGSNHQTLVSEDIVNNLLYLISNTGPAIQCRLLEVLVGLTSSPTTVINVVSMIRISGAISSMVQFVDVRENDELRLASIKLLYNLAPHMSEELATALHGTVGQLGSLIAIISENTSITEEQAAAAGLLAELPERDLALTQQMLQEGAFEKIIFKVVGICQGEIKGIRFQRTFLEGLVRILARITFVFAIEPRAITFCRDKNLASIFINLLQSNGQDNIQMVCAMALENLSLESKNLTRVPEFPPPTFCASIFSCVSKPTPTVTGLCKIHGGICSLQESFCLLEGQAVDKLMALLDHENEKVVEAALAAVSTLLDDELDIEKGVRVLDDVDGIPKILNILLNNRTENLRRRWVWAVERILRIDGIAREVAGEQNVSAALVDAFQNADYRTKQIAEKALRHIDRIPNFSGIFSNAA